MSYFRLPQSTLAILLAAVAHLLASFFFFFQEKRMRIALLLIAFAIGFCRAQEGVHLAFGNQRDERGVSMTVMWLTDAQTEYSKVHYNVKDLPEQVHIASGVQSTYYINWMHRVELMNLNYSTTYEYKVYVNDSASSVLFNFTTLSSQQTHFRAAFIGDMGVRHSEQTMARLTALREEVDFVFIVGDLAYADDEPRRSFEELYNEFQRRTEAFAAYVPFMVIPGNHDVSCSSVTSVGCNAKLTNFTAFNARYSMPSAPSGGVANLWWSMSFGLATLVNVNTETDYPHAPEGRGTLENAGPFGDQLGWLRDQLQRANAVREQRPWLIVTGHRPMYAPKTVGDFPPFAQRRLRNAIEQMLIDAKVDLYICGHVHSLFRQYPVAHGKVVQRNYVSPRAPTQLVIGNAGNIEGHTQGALLNSSDPHSLVAAANQVDYGYSIIEVLSPSQLQFTAKRSRDNRVLDQMLMSK
jgi:acid phosphatase type 7